MRLLIIRHADPDYVLDSITPAGRLEAQALSERMEREGPDLLFTSPLGRAKATMGYTADRLKMSGEVLEFTRELSGWRVEEEGLGSTCVWDVHGHRVRTMSPKVGHDDWHTRAPFDVPEFREGFKALGEESDRFLARFGYVRDGGVYRVEKRNELKLAVFCHGGLGLTWLAHLLDVPLPVMWSGFFMAPSSVTTILFDERVAGVATPRCIGFADVSHLYAAGLRAKPSGIRANFY